MKNKTRRCVPLLIALAALAVPATASAQALFGQGTPIIAPGDPSGTVLTVVPPKGGSVMLYQGKKVVAWWPQPGFASLEPGQVYGVVGLRGSTLIFNAGLKLRPGHTKITFGQSSYPSITYEPPLYYAPMVGHPGYPGYGYPGYGYPGYPYGHPAAYGPGAYGHSHAPAHPSQAAPPASQAAAQGSQPSPQLNAWEYRRLERQKRVQLIKAPLSPATFQPKQLAAAQAPKQLKLKLVGKKLSLAKQKLTPVSKQQSQRRADGPQVKRAPRLVPQVRK